MDPTAIDDADVLVASVARTNVQLFNQLSAQSRPDSELARIRRAYDLAARLYSGAYQADGKPFITHVVSVSSILALLDQPSTLVAAALLHNVYNNADFGDGLRRTENSKRRRFVRAAVGEDVETLIHGFAQRRIDRHLSELVDNVEQLSETERQLVIMDLADLLEKYLDQGVLYFGQGEWVTGFAERRLEDLVCLSDRVGQPVLGAALRRAIGAARNARIPEVLRSSGERKYVDFLPPLSYRRKLHVVLQQVRFTRMYRWLRSIKHRVIHPKTG